MSVITAQAQHLMAEIKKLLSAHGKNLSQGVDGLYEPTTHKLETLAVSDRTSIQESLDDYSAKAAMAVYNMAKIFLDTDPSGFFGAGRLLWQKEQVELYVGYLTNLHVVDEGTKQLAELSLRFLENTKDHFVGNLTRIKNETTKNIDKIQKKVKAYSDYLQRFMDIQARIGSRKAEEVLNGVEAHLEERICIVLQQSKNDRTELTELAKSIAIKNSNQVEEERLSQLQEMYNAQKEHLIKKAEEFERSLQAKLQSLNSGSKKSVVSPIKDLKNNLSVKSPRMTSLPDTFQQHYEDFQKIKLLIERVNKAPVGKIKGIDLATLYSDVGGATETVKNNLQNSQAQAQAGLKKTSNPAAYQEKLLEIIKIQEVDVAGKLENIKTDFINAQAKTFKNTIFAEAKKLLTLSSSWWGKLFRTKSYRQLSEIQRLARELLSTRHDLILISPDKNQMFGFEELHEASRVHRGAPILIKQGNNYKVFGNKNGGGWQFTDVNSETCQKVDSLFPKVSNESSSLLLEYNGAYSDLHREIKSKGGHYPFTSEQFMEKAESIAHKIGAYASHISTQQRPVFAGWLNAVTNAKQFAIECLDCTLSDFSAFNKKIIGGRATSNKDFLDTVAVIHSSPLVPIKPKDTVVESSNITNIQNARSPAHKHAWRP
jgi:hypothetical protein